MYQKINLTTTKNTRGVIIAFLLVIFIGYLWVSSLTINNAVDNWTNKFRSKYDQSYNVPSEKGKFSAQFKEKHFFKGPIDKDTLLENANDLIYRYVDLPLEFSMGSAAIPLAVCGLLTTGDILELGMGTYSTNVLHKIGIKTKENQFEIK